MKTTRNEGMEMCNVNSVTQEFDFDQVSCNLPDVICGGDNGDSLPAKMFHESFEKFFHFSVGTL